MWCEKILVAYDGSNPSRKAVELAFGIAESNPNIELLLVHVMRFLASGNASVGIDSVLAGDMETMHSELELLCSIAPNKASSKILTGTSAADLIVKCAKEENCDLIVMGSRGETGVRGYLGSVSYAVTKDSPVAVLIAKDEE